jgi:hypothetical protein
VKPIDQRSIADRQERVARGAHEHRFDQALDRHRVGRVDQPLTLL